MFDKQQVSQVLFDAIKFALMKMSEKDQRIVIKEFTSQPWYIVENPTNIT